MGILDNPEQMSALMQSPLVQMGLGMLSHNQGRYALQNAIGGGSEGLQQAQAYKHQATQQQMLQMQMDEMKRQIANKAALQSAFKTYGQPNSSVDSTTTTNNPAPQGTDAPNFGTVPQSTTTSSPTFDQGKWINSVLPYMDEKDALGLMTKQNTYTYENAGDRLIQKDMYGNLTGKTVPIGVKPDTLLPYQSMTADEKAKFIMPDANTVANNNTSRANNYATVGATIRGQNISSQNDQAKNNPLGLPPPGASAPSITSPKVASFQDIADTAKASGKSTAQVTADLKAQGYKIGGK